VLSLAVARFALLCFALLAYECSIGRHLRGGRERSINQSPLESSLQIKRGKEQRNKEYPLPCRSGQEYPDSWRCLRQLVFLSGVSSALFCLKKAIGDRSIDFDFVFFDLFL